MRRGVELSLALALVLILYFASPRTEGAIREQKLAHHYPARRLPPPIHRLWTTKYFKTRVEPIFLKKRTDSRPLLRVS